jgi:uncharacterized protein (TIGR00251 family)
VSTRPVELRVSERDDALRIELHVKPRSSRSKLLGVRADGSLSVALKAPPVDGAANRELVKLLAKQLGMSRQHVTIASGEGSRSKLVEVRGMSAAALRERVAELLG